MHKNEVLKTYKIDTCENYTTMHIFSHK